MLKELNRKTQNDIVSELTTISPEVARAWLGVNHHNRKRQPRFVRQFARDMSAGKWIVTGDSIKFDTNKHLIDGQHRLAACVEAGVPFRSVVIYNLPPSSQNVIDTGKTRTPQDVLTINGVQNAVVVAGTLKLLVNEKRGVSNIGGQGTVTHSELIDALGRHPDISLYVNRPGAFPKGISIPMTSYVRYVASRYLGKKDRAIEMVNVLKTGVPDYEDDPIHAFRERLLRQYAEAVGGARNREATYWTLKHCWNLFAKRQPIGMLRWRNSDVDIEGLDLRKL